MTAGAPEWLTSPLGDAQDMLVVPLVLSAVYAGLRKIESHMPPLLTRVLLGSNTPPSYPTDDTSSGRHAPDTNAPRTLHRVQGVFVVSGGGQYHLPGCHCTHVGRTPVRQYSAMASRTCSSRNEAEATLAHKAYRDQQRLPP